MTDAAFLDELFQVLEDRRDAAPEVSYTARLHAKGKAKIAQKVGEEAVETVIEAMRGDNQKLAEESADLLYHLLVLWQACDLPPAAVYDVLADRFTPDANPPDTSAPHTSAPDTSAPDANPIDSGQAEG
ncbi:MAG: phosphoribosyl-ATP diphosphatase [Pseudomonadota bacterium]